jgi:hypothetical protein
MSRTRASTSGSLSLTACLLLSACANASHEGAVTPIAVNQAGVGERLSFGQRNESAQASSPDQSAETARAREKPAEGELPQDEKPPEPAGAEKEPSPPYPGKPTTEQSGERMSFRRIPVERAGSTAKPIVRTPPTDVQSNRDERSVRFSERERARLRQ